MTIRCAAIAVRPLGLHFAERNSSTRSVSDLALQYLEVEGYTALLANDSLRPFIEADACFTVTQPITEQRKQPADGDDHATSVTPTSATDSYRESGDNHQGSSNSYAVTAFLTTVTSTKSIEGPDEEDPDRLHW